MNQAYTVPFLRAFRQAPWRTQTQAVAAWAIILLIVAVLGGLYLSVASRAATAGRDLQNLELRKAALLQGNDELRAELARLRSTTYLYDRARALGFYPAQDDQIEYLSINNYPAAVLAPPPPVAAAPPTQMAALGSWFVETLNHWLTGQSRSGR